MVLKAKGISSDKKWRFLRNGPWLIVIGLAAVVIPPLTLFLLYAIGRSYPLIESPWTAGEALGYCGAVDAAIVALLGLLYSICDGWEQQRTQLRESAAPYFSMVALEARNKKGPFSREGVVPDVEDQQKCSESSMLGYCEVVNRELYAIIGDGVVYRSQLDAKQRECVESTFLRETCGEGVFAIVKNPVIYLPLRFRNVGQGCANGVRVGVNRKTEEWKGYNSGSFDHGEGFYLGVYVDTEEANAYGGYGVGIVFNDCLGYKYMQVFDLIVKKEDSDRSSVLIEYVGRKTLID